MKTVHIHSNWYFSAGAKYGWVKDGLDVRGVGLRMSDLQDFKIIKVDINGEEYLLTDTKDALKSIDKYNSIFVAGGSTEIGVISRSLLRQILRGDEIQQVTPTPEQQNNEEETFGVGETD